MPLVMTSFILMKVELHGHFHHEVTDLHQDYYQPVVLAKLSR